MIQSLIEYSIRNRKIRHHIFLFIAISVFSLKMLELTPFQTLARINKSFFLNGLAGLQDIEEQVTYPLSILMQGIPGVKNISATSAFGFSMISIIF